MSKPVSHRRFVCPCSDSLRFPTHLRSQAFPSTLSQMQEGLRSPTRRAATRVIGSSPLLASLPIFALSLERTPEGELQDSFEGAPRRRPQLQPMPRLRNEDDSGLDQRRHPGRDRGGICACLCFRKGARVRIGGRLGEPMGRTGKKGPTPPAAARVFQ